MAFKLSSKDYIEYIKSAYKVINENGEYITDLDLATGDGDHWSNINKGFKSLVEKSEYWNDMNISDLFKEIGKTMMSVIGGSSGLLYGSAYIAASKVISDEEYIDKYSLYLVLQSMLDEIMKRGQSKPGYKTMIDSLYPAVKEYKTCIDEDVNDINLCIRVKKAAEDGAESTKGMEAVRGRATYQSNKGVGHLDPGAITMSYQILCLMDIVQKRINDGE